MKERVDSTVDSQRVMLSYPDDWEALTDAEKDAVCLAMARELQNGLARS